MMTSRTVLILLLAIFSASGARAQNQIESPGYSTESLFERVSGSVCTIFATHEGQNLLRRGSGFILKGSRLLVTNAHVLIGFEEAEIRCGEQSAAVKKITNYDGETDLVLAATGALQVEGLLLAPTTQVRPGTQVYAFGSPYGLEGTITPGLTSAYREIEGQTYIQISAPISPGNSGGPVTDAHGMVIGVLAAALEVAQNINFAIPAAAINDLPAVDLRLADLGFRQSDAQAQIDYEVAVHPDPDIAAGRAAFRGHAFGTTCGEIAITEYERQLSGFRRKGLTRFARTYSGELEFDIRLLGAPATVIYTCDERFGLVGGRYEIRGHEETVTQIEIQLSKKYGVGTLNPIAEVEASKMGCLWNFSLPGSRFYRPSSWTVWQVDGSLRIELLICGGNSKSTFVFYTDPSLTEIFEQAKEQAADYAL